MKKIIKKMIIVSAMLGSVCFMNNVDAAALISDDISTTNDIRMIEDHKAFTISTVDSGIAGKVLGGNTKMTSNISIIESTENNYVYIKGSCYYVHNPEKHIKINIYIGGDKGDINVYHTYTTAQYANNTKGWFAISLSGAIPTGNQSINIYGYNEYSGKDEKIYSGKLYINGNFNHSPEGTISSFYSPADHQVYISGKVYDRDDMSRQVPVQVNIGPNASDSIRFYVAPNQTFSRTLSFPNVSGAQGFNIYAIDDYGPNRKDTVLKSGTIEVKPINVPPPPPPPPEPTTTSYRVSTNNLNLNLRSGMSNTASIIAKMPSGSIVTGTDQGNGWARVTYNGIAGYASMQYLSPIQPPVPPPTPVGDVKSKLRYAVFNDSSARITCDFDGYVNTKGRHEGIDMALYHKAPVYSAIAGTVIRTGGDYNTVAIYDSTHDKTVIYLHFNSIAVSNGSYVSKGSLIGYQGSKGASASHVHLEVRNGRRTSAAKSVNDYTLDNPNPYSYWNSVL